MAGQADVLRGLWGGTFDVHGLISTSAPGCLVWCRAVAVGITAE